MNKHFGFPFLNSGYTVISLVFHRFIELYVIQLSWIERNSKRILQRIPLIGDSKAGKKLTLNTMEILISRTIRGLGFKSMPHHHHNPHSPQHLTVVTLLLIAILLPPYHHMADAEPRPPPQLQHRQQLPGSQSQQQQQQQQQRGHGGISSQQQLQRDITGFLQLHPNGFPEGGGGGGGGGGGANEENDEDYNSFLSTAGIVVCNVTYLFVCVCYFVCLFVGWLFFVSFLFRHKNQHAYIYGSSVSLSYSECLCMPTMLNKQTNKHYKQNNSKISIDIRKSKILRKS